MWTSEVSVADGKYSVTAHITCCGRDVNVTIGGGEASHIGASALAVPRPSLSDPDRVSASTSVICVPGHKEDMVARAAAERIAASRNCVASVSVGVHIDCADREELFRLQRNLDALVELVIKALEE